MQVLALIPARGGSKGIPRKNLVDVAGKPLIAWTVESALRLFHAGILEDVVVSTEDAEIASVCKTLGAGVPFVRPPELADDRAKTVDVVLHALDVLESQGKYFDAVLLLQATAPLRQDEDILASLRIFAQHQADSLISVNAHPELSPLILYRHEGDFGLPFDPNHNKGVRRQDQSPVLVRNGAIYLTRVDYIKEHGRLIGDKPLLYVMPEDRSVNVDTLAELERVRCSLAK